MNEIKKTNRNNSKHVRPYDGKGPKIIAKHQKGTCNSLTLKLNIVITLCTLKKIKEENVQTMYMEGSKSNFS